ncbi:cyclic nucleotide-binding domain-containing protein [Vibrio sp. ZSDZ65]|uniref:Cyclic nucleotide-binding domain-containing protein n=1 Tax=Vibrio qingdaonensis TaxID=2829491 RepID=A0A9X3CSA5_9VIBR|nr:cyclic nucleotide-binding domain-containing protein [Vibrio qingdaonensis]MCW8348571.1 cyclic nucleotide-binding domain-containing protein [Vibrio qingdaonensis]
MNVQHALQSHYHATRALADKLIEKGLVVTIPKGKFLCFQDQPTNEIIVPLRGVLGFCPTIDEGTTLSYNLITPGIVINDVPLILGQSTQSDIQAMTDCKVLTLPFPVVETLLDTCCAFSKMLNLSLAKKQRFCLTLFRLRGEKNTQLKIQLAMQAITDVTSDGSIPLNISTLASLLNMSRNTVGRYISQAIVAKEVIKVDIGYRLITPVTTYNQQRVA